MLKILHVGYFGLSPAISEQFTLEMCDATKIEKKSLTPPFVGDKGHSRSLMLIALKSSSPVLIMISSMTAPICNRFHVRQANDGKITFLREVPFFLPLVQRDNLHPAA